MFINKIYWTDSHLYLGYFQVIYFDLQLGWPVVDEILTTLNPCGSSVITNLATSAPADHLVPIGAKLYAGTMMTNVRQVFTEVSIAINNLGRP